MLGWEREDTITAAGLSLGILRPGLSPKGDCLNRGWKPVLQDILGVWLDLAKPQPHAQVGMRKDHCGRRLEDVCLCENLHLHKAAVGQGINGVDVTAGSTKVTDAGAHARAGIFRKDLGRSDEGKSGCATPLFFHRIAFPGTHILYPTCR
jgi:hypothetical protein